MEELKEVNDLEAWEMQSSQLSWPNILYLVATGWFRLAVPSHLRSVRSLLISWTPSSVHEARVEDFGSGCQCCMMI